MDNHEIILIHLPNRQERALGIQQVLTKYGNRIKTRLGMHDAVHGSGVIMLEMMGAQTDWAGIEGELTSHGAEVKRVTFTN